MNYVQPIKDRLQIDELKQSLLRISYRDYMIFAFGVNTGLRISDILNLKVSDVRNKDYVTVKEQKTQKTKRFKIQPQFKEEVEKYIQGLKPTSYLFPSRKGTNKPLGRIQYYRILQKAADPLGIKEIGTHTLRKTFGYFHYKANKDVAVLQEIFNHSAPSITMRYIGISQEEIDKTMEGFYL